MKKIRQALDGMLSVLAGTCFLAMTVLTCWQVFTRFVLKNPSSWSEELISYLFAWASLLGAVLVTGERGHMNIPILVEKLNPLGQKLLNCFGELVALVFSAAILIYGGTQINTLAMGQMTSSLGVAVGVFYVLLPVCGMFSVVYTILNIVDIWNGTQEERKVE
jgi:TRAP-type C4-dicarboxylate transport system permease small subunit|nr:TRAP transporter small permease [uncultured Schaedlerella sp.]